MRGIAIGILIIGAALTAATGPAALPFVLPLQSVGLWEALSALSNIIAPILGAIVAFVIWLHKRIEALEDQASQQRRSLYGNEDDGMQRGIINEVINIKDSVDNIKDQVDNKDNGNSKDDD